MRDWLKISFHQSRTCHIKSNKTHPWEKDFEWKYDEVCQDERVHVMRVIYSSDKLTANFEVDKRVNFFFEKWNWYGSLYLDVFLLITTMLCQQKKNVVLLLHIALMGENGCILKLV